MGEFILYVIVAMIIGYEIQTLCLKPRKKVVSSVLLGALPMVVILVFASVVGVLWSQFSHGQNNSLFDSRTMFDIFGMVMLFWFFIAVIVGMFAGVAVAWIVFAIKWYRAEKESDIDTEDEVNGSYEESDG